MEYENKSFGFLEDESSKRYFADLDFALREGKHIQNYGNDYKLWEYVEDKYDELVHYYYSLFGINLRKENNDQQYYYYLDFSEDSKGKFTANRSKEIGADRVIVAILFLNIYKEKFFEEKELQWTDIDNIFENSEQKQLWHNLFFKDGYKRNYTPQENDKLKDDFRKILNDFERLGWINWIDKQEIHFVILPSIDRIAKLYKNEIREIETLSKFIDARN